jgi:hypothetical protein
MSNQPAASPLNEHSLVGIGASLVLAVALGFLFNAIHAPDSVQSSVLAIAVGLPAAIAYRQQGRRRDKTEDAARIAQGELRRPVGLVVAMLAAALLLTVLISGSIPTVIIGESTPAWLAFGCWFLIGAALGFVMSSYASHYLGKHPYRWTTVAAGIVTVLWASFGLTVSATSGDGWGTALLVLVTIFASLLPFVGACVGGAWYGKRHHAKFLQKKLARMKRKAARQAVTSSSPPCSITKSQQTLRGRTTPLSRIPRTHRVPTS